MSVPQVHLSTELSQTGKRVDVNTRFGLITGGRALNGAAAFLEVPYALPPGRFEDPICLPSTYQYEQKAYIHENLYAVQPNNDGQAGDGDPRNKLGFGKPTENPLFLNIVTPPGFPSKRDFPVKIYIHGGFLQFGSPHGLSGQAQYVAAEREEVYVNPGYRLSAFGFLASDSPPIPGNFGFKDLWLALEWIRDNIADFGGDPTNITLTGLSAGAHAAHQLLHHASRLPRGVNAPFQRAVLQSNAIATNPKTPAELRAQYLALLHSLDIDDSSPSAAYATLANDAFTSASLITHTISTTIAPEHGTFRGTSDSSFLPANEMQWQASGGFARALREKGVKSIVVGEVAEEWYLYSIAHPVEKATDVRINLKRYYPDEVVDRLLRWYPPLGKDASKEDCVRLFGRILSDSQVHLPIRLLHRDLQAHGFPVVRYHIGWTPPQYRTKGYITHATDRPIWAFRLDVLTPQQLPLVRSWLDAVVGASKEVEKHGTERSMNEMLTLREDGIGWEKDDRWAEMERLARVVEGTGEGVVKGKL